VTFPKKEKNTL